MMVSCSYLSRCAKKNFESDDSGSEIQPHGESGGSTLCLDSSVA